MKTVKLSLIAALTAGLCTGASASDTLADAFKNGKVSGAIQAYYWDRDNGTKDADIMNFGLDLSYETARFHGFGLKATMQSSSSPFIDDDAKDVFKSDMHGSGASLSEAYLSYAMAKTTAQVGRMFFATPLIYGSGSRMNREAFEGALVTNSDIPDTKLTVGYVNKMQNRTDKDGNFGNFSKINFGNWQGDLNDGAYTIVVQNSSIPNTNLTFAYLNAKDLMKVTYSEASFKKDIFGFAAQYYTSDAEINTKKINLFGLKATVQLDKLGLLAAYTTTSDRDVYQYVYAGLGNGSDYAFTASPMLSDSYVDSTDAYRLSATYQVTNNFKVGANYGLEDNDRANEKYSLASVTTNYAFTGALKGLNANVMYEQKGKDADKDELRVNLVYSF